MKRQKKLSFIDLFCGAGGMSHGFKKEGFELLFAVDNNEYCKKVYEKNFPGDKFFHLDLKNITNQKFKSLIGRDNVDLVVGGPPCQGFSTIGNRVSSNPTNRSKKDDRNNLVYEFIRLVEVAKPKMFVMENVKGILTRDEGKIFSNLLKMIERLGFSYRYRVLNAADYGVPQFRKRVFIIGTKIKSINLEFPDETHGPELLNLDKYVTVEDAFLNLDEKNNLKNHVPLRHKEKNIRRYKMIPEGSKLPENKLPKDLYRRNFGNTFKRLSRYEPSLTIVPGHNAFPIHPTKNRSLTVREAARLQTFDDDFEFIGPRHEQCIQVGNAIPPLLARKFAAMIKNRVL